MMAEGSGDLAAMFRRLIVNTGPISVGHFMAEANARYYNSADPLGSAGDFITAPEISQMFGELVGLWLADSWSRAGRPGPVHYVEVGPGRGTLARDALRAARRFGLEPAVHLVETSAALRDIQRTAIPGATWHDDLSSLPPTGPLLLVANEFLDALPIRQMVKTENGWRERKIGLEGGGEETHFVFVSGSQPMDSAIPQDLHDAEVGTILETSPAAAAALYEIAGRLVQQGGTALFIDYGYDQSCQGSTLQAVRAHRKVDPFSAPGESDLTAHVDFGVLARVAASRGARWLGTVPQGRWLRELGIEARAQALAVSEPEYADAVELAKHRLIDDDQMGTLFKVMALSAPEWPDGAGF